MLLPSFVARGVKRLSMAQLEGTEAAKVTRMQTLSSNRNALGIGLAWKRMTSLEVTEHVKSAGTIAGIALELTEMSPWQKPGVIRARRAGRVRGAVVGQAAGRDPRPSRGRRPPHPRPDSIRARRDDLAGTHAASELRAPAYALGRIRRRQRASSNCPKTARARK